MAGVVAPIKGKAWEDGGVVTLGRVVHGGVYVTQAALTSIAYKVFDLRGQSPETATSSGSLTVAVVIFNTLQGVNGSDNRWTEDLIGFNFLAEFPAAAFPTGGHLYRIEIIFTPVSGQPFPVIYDVEIVGIRSS